jgi:hypothetical protein
VDISDLAKPVMLDDIFFGKEREAVRATYFDTQRQILYAITATADPDALQGGNVDFAVLRERRERLRIYDPLYTIQISQPASLTILGALDDLNGDMNLFRPIQGEITCWQWGAIPRPLARALKLQQAAIRGLL